MFGVSSTVATDRTAQFESELFQTLLYFFWLHAHSDPAANGIVERLHHQLKTALRAAEGPGNWSDHLPLALLEIRAALKLDMDCSAAELVLAVPSD
ncbi:hypothetical protein SprV_0100130400 [Sparganum proliferum]